MPLTEKTYVTLGFDRSDAAMILPALGLITASDVPVKFRYLSYLNKCETELEPTVHAQTAIYVKNFRSVRDNSGWC